ncbi:MAG: DUF433 domain-containing protein [Chloroflexi bacterium]|nr:DUF433 domain-containing protein [Chloroflexota bacterium]
MTTQVHLPKISGIYGISEVARYLSVTLPKEDGLLVDAAKLRYWIRTSASSISDPLFPTTKRLITFQDVVSMRMIAVLRAKGISLQKIRDMETWVRHTFDTEWPFAFRPMWVYRSDVFIEFERRLIAATRFGQLAMEFIREWLEEIELDMTFDTHDVANLWTPHSGIQLDPHVQFGEPCVEGTDIPTKAIWSKIKAGDTTETVASVYDLDVTQVQDAIDWERHLADAAA